MNFIRVRGIVHSVKRVSAPAGDHWKYAHTHCGLAIKRYNCVVDVTVTCLGCMATK